MFCFGKWMVVLVFYVVDFFVCQVFVEDVFVYQFLVSCKEISFVFYIVVKVVQDFYGMLVGDVGVWCVGQLVVLVYGYIFDVVG